PVLTADDALALQRLVREVAAAEPALRYAAQIARATRPDEAGAPALVKKAVRWGAGPRAGQALILGAKAHALLNGRTTVSPTDLRRVALPVLRHRVLVGFAAEADGITPEQVVAAVLDAVRGVRWSARRPVAPSAPGSHRSRRHGIALEFTEYRPYRQGDDPRRLDWKLLARTDRAYVRLTDDHTVLPTTIVVDASASMAYPAATLGK